MKLQLSLSLTADDPHRGDQNDVMFTVKQFTLSPPRLMSQVTPFTHSWITI